MRTLHRAETARGAAAGRTGVVRGLGYMGTAPATRDEQGPCGQMGLAHRQGGDSVSRPLAAPRLDRATRGAAQDAETLRHAADL